MYSKDETRLLRKKFWESFSNYTNYFSQKIGEPIEWLFYKTGIKWLELKFDVEKKNIRVVLEINAKNEEKRFDIYAELDMYKNIINNGFEPELIWIEEYELPEGKIVSRIYTELKDVNYHNQDNWPKIFKFMAENMHRLQSNFIDIQPILKDKFE